MLLFLVKHPMINRRTLSCWNWTRKWMVQGMLKSKLSISERKMKNGPNIRMTTQRDMETRRTRGSAVELREHQVVPDLVPLF